MCEKHCNQCHWYSACYNSEQRYREDVHAENISKPCEDFKSEIPVISDSDSISISDSISDSDSIADSDSISDRG
ncbi:hypothetical protein D3C81_08510 [compost metagenome]